MPQSTKQTRGEIICELRKEGLITEERLDMVMADAGVESPATVKNYKRALIGLKLLERVEGGYILTKKAREDYIITIRVPMHNKGEVIKGLTAALQQFKPLAVMELND